MNRKKSEVGLLLALVLLLVAFVPLSGQVGTYDPWADINDDGKIDGRDIARVAKDFGTLGTPITKASFEYDSGWIDISDKQGQYFSVTPGFNLETSTWFPRIYGEVGADLSPHQKYWYGYGMPGWNQTYGGTSTEYGYSVVQTVDGGYAIAGYTTSFGSGSQAYLVKTSADGTMQWNRTYGGADSEIGFSVVQTSDGGYAIAGDTRSFSSSYDAYLVKTFADGTVDWQQTYGGTVGETAHSVVQTVDGGYAIAGLTTSFGSGSQAYLVKTSADGTMQWNRTYGGADSEIGFSVVQTSDGGYAIAGYTNSFGSSYDAYLVKIDAFGLMDLELGVTIANITAEALTFYRGKKDPYYNYIRVQIWVVKENP